MAVEAAYSILEYLKTELDPIADPDSIEFEPGSPSAPGTDNTFGTYRLVMDTDFQQPYIHQDRLNIRLYHVKFDTLAKLVAKTLQLLNNESVYDNPALASCGTADGIRFIDVIARQNSHGQNEFVDSTEYHVAGIDILLEYVEL